MQSKLIGILAGMGPRSTAPFIDSVVTQCQQQYGAKYDNDFPHMMIYSLPAPFYVDGPLNHEKVKQTICAGLKRLQDTSVDFIAMPCNAAHLYYEELLQCLSIPLLNMIDETLANIPSSVSRVALIATRFVAEAEIYQNGLGKAGFTYQSDEKWQKKTDELVVTVKSSPDISLAQNLWKNLVTEMAAEGVDTVLLGCTDLTPLTSNTPEHIRVIDATECLAKAVVQRYLSIR